MLILILSHGSVQLFIIKIFQIQHRRNVFQSIEKGTIEEDLILFKFSKDDLESGLSHVEWVEENEFRIDGEMYDVVKREVKKDSVYVYCFHDEKESVLYSAIVKIFKKLFGDDRNNLKNLVAFNSHISEFYYQSASELNMFYLAGNGRYLPVKVFHLLDGKSIVDTPPPRT